MDREEAKKIADEQLVRYGDPAYGLMKNVQQPEYTLEKAEQELRSMAESLEIDLPSGAGYVERLLAVADFLASIEWIER